MSPEAKTFCKLKTDFLLSFVIFAERNVSSYEIPKIFSIFIVEGGYACCDYST
jgi:hypothetical protein